jgi:hypothetical protein
MRAHAAAEVDMAQLSGRFAGSLTPMVILQACHLAELTGTLRARRGARLASVSFRHGEVVGADALDCEGLDALVALNEWTDGRFEFLGGALAALAPVEGPFQWLMLEVCRRLDESRAAAAIGA